MDTAGRGACDDLQRAVLADQERAPAVQCHRVGGAHFFPLSHSKQDWLGQAIGQHGQRAALKSRFLVMLDPLECSATE